MFMTVIPNLLYVVTHLPLSAERRGPPSQNNKKICFQSSFRYKYEQTKYVLYFNTSIFISFLHQQHWADCEIASVWFLLLSGVFDQIANSWLRCGKSASKIVLSRVKSSRFPFFAFTCRRIDIPDSHKYVPGKSSNFLRASFTTFEQLSDTFSQNSQIVLVFRPRIVPKVDHHLACILQHSRLEQQNDFSPKPSGFDEFGKVQHKFVTMPSKVLNKFWCKINIPCNTSRRGTTLDIEKFPAWAFHFRLSSFLRMHWGCQ